VWRRGGKAERFLNAGTRWERSASRSAHLIPAEGTPVRIGQQAGWATQTTRFLLEKKTFTVNRIPTPRSVEAKKKKKRERSVTNVILPEIKRCCF